MNNFIKNLTTGWKITLTKWSVQLNVANIIWGGGALTALQFGYLPLWFMPYAFWVAVILLALSTIASNLKQKNLQCYDPNFFRLVPIEDENENIN